MKITSKLPGIPTSIFAVMSGLAREHNAINLAQGFPGFDIDPIMSHLVHTYMKRGMNQYAPMSGVPVLRERLADKISNLYGLDVDMDRHITITAGATQALFTAIQAVVHPGDEVILIEPAYDSYRPSVQLAGGIPVPVQMRAPDFNVPWNEIRQKITDKTRLIITNTPHNPSGQVFSADDFQQLKSIVLENDLLLLSDEVYEHLIYNGLKHYSVLGDPELFERSLVTFSFGKVFHATGWKMGYTVAPEHLTKEFRSVHQFNVFSVNSPTQYALADYLQEPERYLGLPAFFAERKQLFENAVKQTPLKALPCNGTYFMLCDYSDISDEDQFTFASRITKEYGVASIPVSAFYTDPPNDHVVRFCFAKEQHELEEAASRLAAISS
jgi:methionine aminotransferase